MRAANEGVACVVVLSIGYGRLGFRHLRKNGRNMPVFAIPESLHHWIKDAFGMSANELEKRIAKGFLGEFKEALDSVKLGLPGDRNVPRPKQRFDLEHTAKQRSEQVVQAIMKSRRKYNNTIN
ncbi:MAG TPA: hypothetical protein VK972_09370 [Wenzhouxiangella sp.]|nr:hypothetical protein [Wenzhouxiangella sp.]